MAGVTRSRETKNGAISNLPIIFSESVTWSCPVAMEAYVFVIGAGGSGAAGRRGGTGTAGTHQGAGAGGCAVSKLTLAAQDYTVTIGAGGAAGSAPAADSSNAGADGGASSFAGTGITTMTGNGGTGGAVSNVSNGAASSAASGGTATGGNLMNNTGGSGLAITDNSSPGLGSGGSVGLWGAGQDGQIYVGTGQIVLEGGNIQGRSGDKLNETSPKGLTNPWTSYILGLVGASTMYGYNSYSGTREFFPSGAPSLSTYAAQNNQYYSPSLMITHPTGPLGGGTALRFFSTARSGGATLGGGGGATIGNANNVYSGEGGGGGIIIIPISIG